MRSAPEVCQRIAELDVLADLARRRNSNLRIINSGSGTDSVPDHHIFNNLQAIKSLSSVHFGPITFGAPALPHTDFDLASVHKFAQASSLG
jgi:hypothetical protein